MRTAKSRAGGRSREVGFSLLELIVVLVILGLLAAIVGPRVVDQAWKAKVKAARLQIEQ
ncbi:MAG: prepilin-type N-terminal cleavage/methylation domain-containing protein, partial [Acidobacteria bacterium]